MTNKVIKRCKKPTAEQLQYNKALKEAFPDSGKVRVPQIAAHLGIGVSTWWGLVKEGRVLPPVKFGARVSVWDAEYIRELAVTGIQAKAQAVA